MKWHSIRTKFFLSFVAVILAIVLSTVFFNLFFFKGYSKNLDRKMMHELYSDLSNKLIKGELTEQYILEKSEETGIQISIVGLKPFRTLLTSARSGMLASRYDLLDFTDSTSFGFHDNMGETGNLLMFYDRFGENALITMYKSNAITERNVQASSQFLAIIGVLLSSLGAIIIYFIVDRIVKPIICLQQQSKKIAELNFSSRFESKSHDEISELGENINEISNRLSETIDTLQSDIKKLTEVDRVRKEFVANVSHEFKTPLGIIKGYAESLKYDLVDDCDAATYYETIISEADRMTVLVQDLISVMQRELGQMKISFESVDLKELCNLVVDKHQKLEWNRKFSIEGDAPIVEADERLLVQVLDNFLTNAEIHGSDGSPIIITIEEKEVVKVSIFNEGNQIPEDKREEIWDSFSKLDKSRVRAKGSGLGLAINKGIIESHGGEVGFYNHEEGVEFYFTLPHHMVGNN